MHPYPSQIARFCMPIVSGLHSNSLTVWAYHLYYVSTPHSAELCVFHSQHGSTNDLADCQAIDAAFPLLRKLAGIKKEELDGEKLVRKREEVTWNTMPKLFEIPAF
uniref:AlNc14C286G10183 protein n=1 Tax=Albugo laibachii Nc14 TaxID=890382 RepID=F0WV40_9STRA|nr:AlNc14C286G10183 [Albugo laibachii Nc14]|eukprot:CCA25277.1 AlNc14C286G10183 [Albugo laibachii Nc14]